MIAAKSFRYAFIATDSCSMILVAISLSFPFFGLFHLDSPFQEKILGAYPSLIKVMIARHRMSVAGEIRYLNFLACSDSSSLVSKVLIFTPAHNPRGTVTEEIKTARGA